MLAPAKAAARKPTNVRPIWMDGQEPRRAADSEVLHPPGAAVALLVELLRAGVRRTRDERELGGHEQAVEDDEEGDDQDFHG